MACGYAAEEGGEHWEVKKIRRWEVNCEYAANERDGWILNFVFVGLLFVTLEGPSLFGNFEANVRKAASMLCKMDLGYQPYIWRKSEERHRKC